MKIVSGELRKDLRWGLARGLGAGVVNSLIILAITAGLAADAAAGKYRGLTPWQIVATFFVAGSLCGLILGVFRPVTESRFGALVVGWVVGTMTCGSIEIAMFGFSEAIVIMSAILGLLTGGGLAVVQFDKAHPKVKDAS